MNKPKQIIIMRKDLNMRKGKMVAQGAHASLAALINQGYYGQDELCIHAPYGAIREWLDGQFTKICVSVNSEQELVDVIDKAKEAGLITSLITDSGLTEFNNVPTITCGAVGPAYPDQLKDITGHLPLL